MTWQGQEAKSRFDEFVDCSLTEGPQIVAREGREEAVLVPIEEWRRVERWREAQGKRALALLLAPEPVTEDMMIPERGRFERRKPIEL